MNDGVLSLDMRRYLTEFLGTFWLVLAISATLMEDTSLVALVVCGILMSAIYAGGPISKAHYNPIVTSTFWWLGAMKHRDVIPYMIVQILAGILAVYLCLSLGLMHRPDIEGTADMSHILIGEILGSWWLCFIILMVAVSPSSRENQYYGLAIAAALFGLIYIFRPVSGAFFNPAVTLGLCIGAKLSWGNLIYYLLAQWVGAGLAYFSYKLCHA